VLADERGLRSTEARHRRLRSCTRIITALITIEIGPATDKHHRAVNMYLDRAGDGGLLRSGAVLGCDAAVETHIPCPLGVAGRRRGCILADGGRGAAVYSYLATHLDGLLVSTRWVDGSN
jgi:hypothetical protein